MRATSLAAVVLAARAWADAPPVATIATDWTAPGVVSRAAPSLQVVPNPLFRRSSPVHAAIQDALRALRATRVRLVLWYPFPRLAVAALEPPGRWSTSWDFGELDPLVEDFVAATEGRPAIVNFSTVPQWLFATAAPVAAPADVAEPAWRYQQGTALRDPTATELAAYFARLASWYVAGGFTDERGTRRTSPHRLAFDTWEVLNEPDAEHAMTAAQYATRYDAIVEAVRAVAPDMKFAGPALGTPDAPAGQRFLKWFLDPRRHRPGVPIDLLTYHGYAVVFPDPATPSFLRTTPRPVGPCRTDAFGAVERFVQAVHRIERMKARRRPDLPTAIDEVGLLAGDETKQDRSNFVAKPLPPWWWNLSAAVFAYQYARLAREGVAVVGASAPGTPSTRTAAGRSHWFTTSTRRSPRAVRNAWAHTPSPVDVVSSSTSPGPQWSISSSSAR